MTDELRDRVAAFRTRLSARLWDERARLDAFPSQWRPTTTERVELLETLLVELDAALDATPTAPAGEPLDQYWDG